MKDRQPILGRRFGNLVAVERDGKRRYRCQCDCGKLTSVSMSALSGGSNLSCGCLRRETSCRAGQMRLKSLVGRRFGRLVIESRAASSGSYTRYNATCDCGVAVTVFATALTNKAGTRSCGCLRAENKGPKHHWWNSKNTEMDLSKRWQRDREFRAWSARVRRRDGCCDVCNAEKTLQAHHLDGWHVAPSFRYADSNGVALCRKCHASFHSMHRGDAITREAYMAFKRKLTRGVA